MFELHTEELMGWVVHFLLPLTRIGAFVMAAPILGTQLVPARVRIVLVIGITLVVVPVLPYESVEDALSYQIWSLAVREAVVGFLLGFFLQVFFHIFVLMGQIIAMQMGLGFASMMDPANGVNVAVVSQVYLVMITLLFLAVNGHLMAIEVLVESFYVIPMRSMGWPHDGFWQLALTGSWLFSAAVLLALPAVTALLVINFMFGVMTRAAPQLNIFTLGFPATLLAGLLILALTINNLSSLFLGMTTQALETMRQLVQ